MFQNRATNKIVKILLLFRKGVRRKEEKRVTKMEWRRKKKEKERERREKVKKDERE